MKKPKGMPKKRWKEIQKEFRNMWDINPVTRTTPKNKGKEKKYNEKEKYDRETF